MSLLSASGPGWPGRGRQDFFLDGFHPRAFWPGFHLPPMAAYGLQTPSSQYEHCPPLHSTVAVVTYFHNSFNLLMSMLFPPCFGLAGSGYLTTPPLSVLFTRSSMDFALSLPLVTTMSAQANISISTK